MSISIRSATRADIDRIAGFQQAMAIETEGRTLDASTIRQGITAVFDDPLKGFYIVAVSDSDENSAGEVVGSLLITYEWSDWSNANHWWIQSVYVDAAWRRRGVYRTMYEHILALTRDRSDICSIRLYVERTNTIAQQTYKNLGMSHSHYDMYEIDLTQQPLAAGSTTAQGPADRPDLPTWNSGGHLTDIADRDELYRAMEED